VTAELLSIVIPVYNEGENLVPYLEEVLSKVSDSKEILVVHDMPEDTTVSVATRYMEKGDPVRPLLNTLGAGPAFAIRCGIETAKGDVVVVTMADGSDDASQIDDLARLVRDGAAVAVASRYMRGGRQIGGPAVKSALSRLAGVSLNMLARTGTHDPTNSFKAYRSSFVEQVGIESTAGFEIGIELVAKASRYGDSVAEIPTTWTDRDDGESRFHLLKWIPRYLKWWLFALGPRIDSPRTLGGN
jgi:dolichol-phosphate mannosyltransferase